MVGRLDGLCDGDDDEVAIGCEVGWWLMLW